MRKARQNPDGSISLGDERYRVREREPHCFDVVRERDGQPVGAFRLLPDSHIETEGEPSDVVEAVAGVLASPHGPVPLQ